MTSGYVADQVVAWSVLGEIFLGIVDYVICAEGTDQVYIPCVGHGRDFGYESLGNLHRERSYSTARAVDKYLLSGLELPIVADRVYGDDCGDVDCSGFCN